LRQNYMRILTARFQPELDKNWGQRHVSIDHNWRVL
jgi:hypothetical protein